MVVVISVIVFAIAVSLVRYVIYGYNKEEKEVNKILDFLIDGNFTWEKQKYEGIEKYFNSEGKFVLRIDCGGVSCCFVLSKDDGIEVFREDGTPKRNLIELKIESSFYNGSVNNSEYPKIDTLYEKVTGYEIYEDVSGKDAVKKLSLLNNYLKEYF